jgi:hypothetical protein
MRSFTAIAILSFIVTGVGCGQSSQAVKAPDQSAESYHQQAAREAAASQRELVAGSGAPAPNLNASGGNNPQGYYFDVSVYSTRDQHLARARELSEHAQQHEALAAKLESFEETECKQFPAATRAACPLLGPVKTLVDSPNGVKVEFAPGTRVDAVLAHMRCHLAFAQARGFESSSAACPLYIRGIEIRPGADPNVIEIVSANPRVAHEIQSRSRAEAVLVRAASN